MREPAHFLHTCTISNAIRFLTGGANCMGTLPKGWLRGVDLNHRPLGYEPNELPDCSTPQLHLICRRQHSQGLCPQCSRKVRMS